MNITISMINTIAIFLLIEVQILLHFYLPVRRKVNEMSGSAEYTAKALIKKINKVNFIRITSNELSTIQ